MRAAKAGVSLAKIHGVLAIVSTSPSPAAHLAAWLTAIESGLPWVADLRDLWAGIPKGAGTTRLRRLPDTVAERVLFLEGGRIVEEGTHQSLVSKGGLYAGLAKLQFETGASAFRGAAE